MDSLNTIVRDVVAAYAGPALNGRSYLTQDAEGTVFTVVDVGHSAGKHVSFVSLVVRVVDDKVVVERDQNDKLVRDALLEAGVPRDQIVLAYAGEPVPELP